MTPPTISPAERDSGAGGLDRAAAILDAFDAGATADAARLQQRAVPLIELMMSAGLPGTVTAKAVLNTLGLPAGPVRPPLRPAGREAVDGLLAAYEEFVSAG